MSNRSVVAMILVLVGLVIISASPKSHASGFTGTGLVCITASTTATNCPSGAPAIGPLTIGSIFTVGVFVNNSAPMGGFDIYVQSDPAYVSPQSATLGTLIASPTFTSICVNGLPTTGACTTGAANGEGVVEVTTVDSSGNNECNNASPCSGMAFTITYKVVAAIASSSISYPTAPGCSVSSVASPSNTCVLVTDNVGNTLQEDIQGALVTQNIVTVNPTVTKVSCLPATIPLSGPATTCTASVNDTSTSPTPVAGSVSFTTNSTGSFDYTTCTLQAGATTGTAHCSVNYTPTITGHHLINGTYSGESTHLASKATFNLPVTAASSRSTSTSIQCMPASPNVNAPTLCTVTVTASSSTSSPSGTVVFTSDSPGTFTPSNAKCTLSTGTSSGTSACSVSYTATAQGSQTISGQYSGDSSHDSSIGKGTIIVLLAPTTASLTCAPASISSNPTTCTATIRDSSTSPTNPTGSVSFTTDASGTFNPPSNECTLTNQGTDSGTCSVTYTANNVGTGTVSLGANYTGDFAHQTSKATPFSLVVSKATPTIAAAVSPATIIPGHSATDLAIFTNAFTPNGTVTYTAYLDSACTTLVFTSSNVPVGTASAAFTSTGTGTYFFKAEYSGDPSNNAVSTTCGASGETLTVVKATPQITATLSPKSITIGASATDTALVSVGFNPTGTITYKAYSDPACTTSVFTSANVQMGSPSAAFIPSTSGTYYFTATYAGDTNNNPVSTSCGASGQTLTVTPHLTTVSVACSLTTVTVSGSTTCTITVADTYSSPTAPTGSVSLTTDSSGTFNPATCTLATSSSSSATCLVTYVPSAVGSGTQVLTASYSGDSTHSSQSGTSSLAVISPAPAAPLNILGLSPTLFYSLIGIIVVVIVVVGAVAIQRRSRKSS